MRPRLQVLVVALAFAGVAAAVTPATGDESSTLSAAGSSDRAAAAADYYLQLDGIEGEARAKGREKEMSLQAFSFGAAQAGAVGRGGGGGGAGKVSFQDISITRAVDKASPKLFLASVSGQQIKRGVLTVVKAGGDQAEALKITFEDILVSSYQLSGSTELPMESISLNFGKVTFEYFPTDEKGAKGGSVKTAYDIKANKAM